MKNNNDLYAALEAQLAALSKIKETSPDIFTHLSKDLKIDIAAANVKWKEYKASVALMAEERGEHGQSNTGIDWWESEKYYRQLIREWIAEVITMSNLCFSHINKKEDADETPIILDALLSVIGNIDMKFTIAIEIFKATASLFKSNPAKTLVGFHKEWIDGLSEQKKVERNFGQVRKYLESKFYVLKNNDSDCTSDCSEDIGAEVVNQEVIDKEIENYVAAKLGPSANAKELYLQSWLSSFTDRDNETDVVDPKERAGYVVINMRYICPVVTMFNMNSLTETGIWKLKNAYIDDAEKPEGTKDAIEGIFGNIPLVELPYKLILKVSSEGANGNRGINLMNPQQQFIKDKNGNWDNRKGDPRIFDNWLRKQSRIIRVNNLGSDSK